MPATTPNCLRLCGTAQAHHANYIHGDPVFSNVIRTNDDQIVMIDMRGQLGKMITTQGDVHYDLSPSVSSARSSPNASVEPATQLAGDFPSWGVSFPAGSLMGDRQELTDLPNWLIRLLRWVHESVKPELPWAFRSFVA